MYEKFTDRARKVMQLANEEAMRFSHEYIGTEHILLGLIKDNSGVAANVLQNLNVDLRKVRKEVELIVMPGPEMVTMGRLPQTPRAKKVIEFTIEEARALNHDYVGTEHLLLGLLREDQGVAAQVLMNLGLRLEAVRKEVLNILSHPREVAASGPPNEAEEKGLEIPAEIRHLPECAREIVAAFDRQIDVIREEKESAVRAQLWEKAAELRDLEYKLRKLRDEFISHWPR
jgi:ATP-dependent Clp protease ATP-binding subunit ClpC